MCGIFFFFSPEFRGVETRTFPNLSKETWEVRRVGGQKVRVPQVGMRRDSVGHGLGVKTFVFFCVQRLWQQVGTNEALCKRQKVGKVDTTNLFLLGVGS